MPLEDTNISLITIKMIAIDKSLRRPAKISGLAAGRMIRVTRSGCLIR